MFLTKNKIYLLILSTALISIISCGNSSLANTWFGSNGGGEAKKYSIKGKLTNLPNHLIVLSEFTPSQMIFHDSIRTNANGEFSISKYVSEEMFFYFQFGDNMGFPILINNSMDLNIVVDKTDAGIKYDITGKNIGDNTELKSAMEIHNKYYGQMMYLQKQAESADPKVMTEDVMNQMRNAYFGLDKNRKDELKTTVKTIKNSLVPYIITEVLLQEEEPDVATLESAVAKAKGYNAKSKYTQYLTTRYNTAKINAIGTVALDINLPTPGGDSLKLSSLKGKYVLIDFWASWCGPCRRENPNNKVMYEKYKSKGFEIYAVSLDKDKASWVAAIQQDGLPWKHVSDLQHWNCAPAKAYKVTGIPATFLLDREGKIIAKNIRGEELNNKMKELFGE